MPYTLAWAVVLLPLGAAIISYVTESARRAVLINIAGTLASLGVAVVILVYRLGHIGQNPFQSYITFFSFSPGAIPTGGFVNAFQPQVGVLIDGLSATVLCVVGLLSLLIQVYAMTYMRQDAAIRRFFVLVSLFTFGMLALVASPNLFDSYVAWEIIGVCSLLLVGHWWHRPAAVAAARKAFIVTRIGDLSLLLAVVFTFNKLAVAAAALPTPPDVAVNSANNEPFNYQTMAVLWQEVEHGQVQGAGTRTLVVLAVLVLVAALAKSAQLPFHLWLPDAMEGPAPASALLHGGLMVVAGVYLVARMYGLFLLAPHVLTAMAVVGALSAVAGAAGALAQTDIKRLLAWATIGQVGLMFTALGVGAFSAGILHLVSNAWSTPLLFCTAGAIISAYGTQDIREMGGVWSRMRTTAVCMLAGCCSAAGVVLFAGFWSKDSVVAGVLRNQFPGGGHVSRAAQGLLVVLVCAAVLLGAAAVFRLFFLAILGQPVRRRGFQPERVREAPPQMLFAAVVLAVLSTLFGFFGIEGARITFGKFVYTGGADRFGFSWGGVLLGGALSLAGVALAWGIWGRRLPALAAMTARLRPLGPLVASGLRFDAAATAGVTRGIALLAPVLPRADGELTDAIVEGAQEGVADLGAEVRRLQTGRLQAYGAGAFAGVVLIAAAITLAATGHLPGIGAPR